EAARSGRRAAPLQQRGLVGAVAAERIGHVAFRDGLAWRQVRARQFESAVRAGRRLADQQAGKGEGARCPSEATVHLVLPSKQRLFLSKCRGEVPRACNSNPLKRRPYSGACEAQLDEKIPARDV